MKLFAIIALTVLLGCTTHIAALPHEGVLAKGTLIAFQPASFGCGAVTIASTGTYKILSGPAGLVGKEVRVLIPCADTPRRKWSSGSGELETFVVGDTHHLWLTQQVEEGLDVPQELPEGWLYVRGASATPLRPNNSFKPSPLRGLGQNPPFSGGPA